MASVRVLCFGVCVALLADGVALATPFLDAGGVARLVALRGGRNLVDDGVDAAAVAATTVATAVADERGLAPAPPARGVDLVDDDLARKTKKKNTTVGEEVLSAIVDGLTGESEDSKFGSDIREQFGILVQAVTKLGVTTINKYAGADGGSTRAVASAAEAAALPKCGQDAADCNSDHSAGRARAARDVDNVGEGRRRQVRRLLVRYLVLLKVFALGIILPGAVLLSLLQSWKAVTLSLMALLLAGVIGIRGLVNTAVKGQPAEVIHSTGPGGHYWRRVSNSDQAGQDPDRLAYGAYVPVN